MSIDRYDVIHFVTAQENLISQSASSASRSDYCPCVRPISSSSTPSEMTGIDQFDDSPFSPMSPQSHNEEPVSSVREPTVTGEDNQCEGEDFGGEPLERDGLTDRQRKALKTVYQCGARRTAFLLVTETYSLLKRCERLGLDFMIMKR